MTNEMPRKYWASMPETSIIKRLVAETPQRLEAMRKNTQKIANVDSNWNLVTLEREKLKCSACTFNCVKKNDSYFGAGNNSSKVMIVTDRPISNEERKKISGEYIGDIFFTSVIKSITKSRIMGSDISACQPWLIAQLRLIKPQVILSIGQKSSIALIGKLINANQEKGNVYNVDALDTSVIIGDNSGNDLNFKYITEIFQTLSQIGNFFEISKIRA
jgi:DNA polymerase